MANKKPIRVNSQVATRSYKVNTGWLKNAAKSLSTNAVDTLKELSPNLSDVVTTVTDLNKTMRRSGVESGAVQRNLENNRYIKMGRNTIQNALQDLRRGNFNNTSRSSLDDSTSTYFGDIGDDSDTGGEGAQKIQVNVDANKGLETVGSAIRQQTELQVKTAKANMDVFVATSSASIAANQKNADRSYAMLTNINNSLQSLVQFQNENMNKFISSSLTYYENMGKIYAGDGRGLAKKDENDRVDLSSAFGKNGQLDMRKLQNVLKQNAKDTFNNSSVGTIANFIDNFGKEVVANPLRYATTAAMSAVIPKAVKASMKSLDKTFGNFISEMMLQFNDKLISARDKYMPDSFLRKAAGIASDVLNFRDRRVTKFDLNGRVTKDAAVFDGITRNAITQEIPRYLRESTAYLRTLVQLQGGDPDAAVRGSQIFNRTSGRFQRYEDYQKDLLGEISETIKSVFDNSDFGKQMNRAGFGLSYEHRETYDKALKEFYRNAEKFDKGSIDLSKLGVSGSDIEQLIQSISYGPGVQAALREALRSTLNGNGGGLGFNALRAKSTIKRNSKIKELQESNVSDIADILGTGADISIDDAMDNVSRGSARAKGASAVSASGYIHHTMTDIFNLLNRGINVAIARQTPYQNFKRGTTQTASNTISVGNALQNQNQNLNSARNNAEKEDFTLSGEEVRGLSKVRTNEQATGKKSKFFQNKAQRMEDMMHSIAAGNTAGIAAAGAGLFGDAAHDLMTSMKQEILTPFTEALIGKKGENGFHQDGVLSSVVNKITDAKNMAVHALTGQAYVKSDGTKVDAAEAGTEESITQSVKNTFKDIRDNTIHFLFGKEKKNNEGIIEKGAGVFRKGFEDWSQALFGKNLDDAKKDITNTLKERSKDMGLGAVAGAGIGVASGGILGTVVGGPIGGALLGSAVGFMSKSEGFQKFLFGDIDPNNPNERLNTGLISKDVQKFFKDNKTDVIGSATVGAIGGAITGGGLLGSLVGGPVAGAILGTGVQLVRKSDAFQRFLYGEETDDGKRIGGILNSFKGVTKDKEGNTDIKKTAGMNAVGAGAGLLASFFTPIGPIGGAAVGLATSMYASKDEFHEYLFGKNGGKEEGKRGLVQRMGAQIQNFVLTPIKDKVKDTFDDLADKVVHKALEPLENLVSPIVGLGERLVNATISKIGNMTKSLGSKIFGVGKTLIGKVVNVFTKNKFGDKKESIISKVANAPGAIMNGIGDFINNSNKKASRKRVYKEGFFNTEIGRAKNEEWQNEYENSKELQSRFKTFEDYQKHQAQFIYYNTQDHDQVRANQKKRELDEKDVKHNSRLARRENRNTTRLISRLTGGQYSSITEEGKAKALEIYKNSHNGKRFMGMTSGEIESMLAPTANDSSEDRNSSATKEVLEKNVEVSQQQLDVAMNQLGTLSRIYAVLTGKEDIALQKRHMKLANNGAVTDKEKEALKKLQEKASLEQAGSDTRLTREDIANSSISDWVDPYAKDARNAEAGKKIKGKDAKNLRHSADYALSVYNDSTATNAEKKQAFANFYAEMDSYSATFEKKNGTKGAKEKIKKRNQATVRTKIVQIDNNNRKIRDIAFNKLHDAAEAKGAEGSHHAQGGEVGPGKVTIVGENGPEILSMGSTGGRILSNDQVINVKLAGVDNDAAKKLLKAGTVKTEITGATGVLPVYSMGPQYNQYTDKSSQIKKDIESDDKLVDINDISQDIGDNDGTEEPKKESLLDKIKNLFGGNGGLGSLIKNIGLIAGGAFLLTKFLKSDAGKKLLEGLGGAVKDSAETISWTNDEKAYEGGVDFSTNASNLGDRIGGATKHPIQFLLGKNGHADAITHAVTRGGRAVLNTALNGRTPGLRSIAKNAIKHPITSAKKVGNAIRHPLNTISNKVSNSALVQSGSMIKGLANAKNITEAGDVVTDVMSKVNPKNKGIAGWLQQAKSGTSKWLKSGAKEGAEEVGENLVEEGLQKVVTTGVKEGAENAAEVTLKAATEKGASAIAGEALETAASGKSSIMKKILELLKKGCDMIAEALKKKFKNSKIVTELSSLCTKVIAKISDSWVGKMGRWIKQQFESVLARIATATGVTATGVGAIAVLAKNGTWMAIGALNNAGKGGTARLFRCTQDAVDWKMRAISASIGCLVESDPGAIVDVVNEVYCAITGDDFICNIASAIYKLISKDSDDAKLEESQAQLKSNYTDYKEKFLESEWQQYLEDNNLTESDLSFDDYKKKVETGEVDSKVLSFDEYNDDTNKTLTAKVWSGIKTGVKTVGHGIASGAKAIGGAVKDQVKTSVASIKTGASIVKSWFTGSEATSYDKNGNATAISETTGIKGTVLKALAKKPVSLQLLEVMKKGITIFVELLAKQFKANSAVQALTSLVTDVTNIISDAYESGKLSATLKEKIGKFTKTKFAGSAAAAFSLGSLGLLAKNAVSVTVGAIGNAGKAGAAKLFHCDKSDVDFKMQAISSAIGAFTGSDIGAVIDLINEIWAELKGEDFLCKFATTCYNAIATEDEQSNLSSSQSQKSADYETYKKKFYESEWQQYLEDNNLTESDLNMEAYIKKVESGEIKSGIQSIDDYAASTGNATSTWSDIKNSAKSLWGSAKSKATTVINSAKAGWNKVTGWFSKNTSKETGSGGVVPFYSQKDPRWANVSYEEGGRGDTMANSGCGPTALAMAVSGTGRKVSPVDAARSLQSVGARDETGTNWNGISKAASKLGASASQERHPSTGFVDSALKQGNPVILAGRSGGYGATPYTPEGHYVVATGMDKNGNYFVNDPNMLGGKGVYNKEDLLKQTGSAWNVHGKNGGRGTTTGSAVSINNTTSKSSSGTGVTPEDVITVAKNELGYLEKKSNNNLYDKTANAGTNNFTKYAADLGFQNGKYWCAAFVCWCLYQAANKDKSIVNALLYGPMSAACETLRQQLRKAGRYSTSIPQAGDLIFFWTKDNNKANHIGIVIGTDAKNVYTVEGNTSNRAEVVPNGGCVAQKTYQLSYDKILGYGRPNYDGVSNFSGISAISTGTSTSSNVNGDMTSDSSSSSTDFITKLTTAFTEGFKRYQTGLFTGKFDTNWSTLLGDSDSSSTDATATGTTDSTTGLNAVTPAAISSSEMGQKTYNFLRSKGLNPYAAAGLMGNLHVESGLQTNNLQNSFEKTLGSDKEYTAKVDSGSYSNFAGDSAGYGLAQWTSAGRKKALYNLAKSKGVSISDPDMQLEYLWSELNSTYKKKVLNKLQNVGSVKEASDIVMTKFESPKDQSESAKNKRASYGQGYYNQYGGKGGATILPTSYTKNLEVPEEGDPMADIEGDNGGKGGANYTGTISGNSKIPATNAESNTELIGLISQIVTILRSSDGKLDMLQGINSLSNSSGNTTVNKTTNVINGGNTTNVQSSALGGKVQTDPKKRRTAQEIARGGL